MQLVDKQDNLAFLLVRDRASTAFQALFKFTSKLGARNQREPMSSDSTRLCLQSFWNFTIDDALRQTFDNRGLADTGFTDQYRVVFGTPLQHLDRAANFLITSDDRVQLALFGTLGQVDGIFFQRQALIFRAGIVSTDWPPRIASTAAARVCLLAPADFNKSLNGPFSSIAASTNNSLEIY